MKAIQGRKEGFDMEEHEKPQGHFFMGFLIGSVLGALVKRRKESKGERKSK